MRYFKGQIAVIMTLVMATLLGCMALGIDLGVMYHDGGVLQKSADAAALAGAGYLFQPSSSAPSFSTNGCSYSDYAKTYTCSYAVQNGVKRSEITTINQPASNPPAGLPPSAQTIEVKLTRQVPVMFLRVLGRTAPYTLTVAASAVSKVPVGGVNGNLFPVRMDYKPANKGLTYGSTVTLTNNYSPVNWGWLNVPLGGVSRQQRSHFRQKSVGWWREYTRH